MATKQKEKKKLPTALKRVKQSKTRRDHRRSVKSRIRTAIRSFQAVLPEKDTEKTAGCLSQVYRLIDKGVKIRLYKKNKAARDKSRFARLAKHS